MLLSVTIIEVSRDLGSECISINLKNQSTDQYVERGGRSAHLEDKMPGPVWPFSLLRRH